MTIAKRWVSLAVILLLAIQAAQVVYIVHRESLTFDEDDHIFAGYMMWRTGDYGLNPEHPPLVKLLAALPVLGSKLWIPPLQGREFKSEAYLDGRDWLARNDGASQRLVFRMRLAAGLLALGLSLLIFFAAREWFGTPAALIALTLAVFDPNLLAHSALVTTDIGLTLFFLASILRLLSLRETALDASPAAGGPGGWAAAGHQALGHSAGAHAAAADRLGDLAAAPKGIRGRAGSAPERSFCGHCRDRRRGSVGLLRIPLCRASGGPCAQHLAGRLRSRRSATSMRRR